MDYKHLVHIRNSTVNEIASIIENQRNIHNTNFLLNDSDEFIELASPQVYGSKSCYVIELVAINRFRRSTMQWNNSNFYPQMYRDLNGCNLLVGAMFEWNDQLASKIIETLKNSLNYKIKNIPYGSSTPSTGYDLFRRAIRYREQEYRTSVPFITVENTFLVPPGKVYTSFEKMFLTFELEVWIAIVVTILIALAVIQVVNLCSCNIQNFVYGRNIRTPTLNLQSTFLTGNQFKMPGRNFARFLVVLFIIWSLIIRTCYQSKLYEYLQADIRKPRIKTIRELLDSNFTFYGGNDWKFLKKDYGVT